MKWRSCRRLLDRLHNRPTSPNHVIFDDVSTSPTNCGAETVFVQSPDYIFRDHLFQTNGLPLLQI